MMKVFILIQYPDLKKTKNEQKTNMGLWFYFFFLILYAPKHFTWKFSLEVGKQTKTSKGQQHKYIMHTFTVDTLNVCSCNTFIT